VIPVYNEAHVIVGSVEKLRAFLQETGFPYSRRVVIADNATTDETLARAQELAERYQDVSALHIPQKGRGRALRKAWLESDADAMCYMDVDLSTDIEALLPLARAVLEEGYDVATGSRMTRGSQITRSLRREITSRGLILLIKVLFLSRLSDTQCGFKAIARRAAQELLPRVENDEWFFDTELLLLAEKGGYRVKDVPVRWVEDLDTRVNVPKTVLEDLQGLLRMRFRRIPRRSESKTTGGK
ncbi:MAG: dolichyl-phosphate beta-glucosyltransferase, partial [Dehalococcoidia bacterium]|nr:dolichyl-phosphate beta-glucosyltransferase [Dehalococcoidia bacterium]